MNKYLFATIQMCFRYEVFINDISENSQYRNKSTSFFICDILLTENTHRLLDNEYYLSFSLSERLVLIFVYPGIILH